MRMSTGSWAVPLISLVAGFAGGLLAVWLVLGDPVVAEETVDQSPAVISAQEFRLVDQRGKPRAILGFSAEEDPYLAMLDRKRPGLSGSASRKRQASRFATSTGKRAWC